MLQQLPKQIHEPEVESESLVQRARVYLEQHFDEPLTLEDLGRHLGVSPHHLQRQFKRSVGVSPKEYVSALRIDALKSRLRDGHSVTDAIYDAGYASGSRFYERSTERLGMTASAYRNGGRGMAIEFTVVPSIVGHLLLAATERGVCSVMLGDDAASIENELRREFPNATMGSGGDDLRKWAEAVVESFDSLDAVDLPLDVVATAFQCQVWRALRAIPKGVAYSYGEIAAAIGNPKAARAVGRACATNPVALLIPCHRAVREDGSVGGYRWGPDRKQRILDRERRAAER
ncbi:MAG: methylated-DNA--[protein]-cysteine S-methyltransferase [Chloroflexi bacterium]|nr:methylated-DNA--[protein]-cysteine S-methyltransferase [Chloroflexota bacterium]